MTADCWRCGVSLSLEEVDLPRQAASKTPNTTESVAWEPAHGTGAIHATPVLAPSRRQITPPLFNRSVSACETPISQIRMSWNQLPSWLVSLLFHLLLLLMLGLLTLPRSVESLSITLSTSVDHQQRIGGRMLKSTDDTPTFDLPVPEDQGDLEPKEKAALLLADEDARELRELNQVSWQDFSTTQQSLQQDDPARTFVTRDPRIRVDVVRREGGTTLTEAAVARGLRWLAKHQHVDGRWSLGQFSSHADCRGRCGGAGRVMSDSAATSLALLPFLGAGQTHESGIYRDAVMRGLAWLIEQQRQDGDLQGDSDHQAAMYAHGQGAIVLCEAYAMTADPRLRVPAHSAIQFIERAQHRGGGWRYKPGQRGDTSVLGWQMMAIQSARAAGIPVRREVLQRVDHYLDRVLHRDRWRYAYQPFERPTHTMTAEALLCRIYLGQDPHTARFKQALQWMMDRYPPDTDEPNIYYWYYAAQTFHHAGGPLWQEWNGLLRDALVRTQVRQGHEAGSWDPQGPHAAAGGRIYMTALAVCTLEVYYRHAPIFRPL